MRWMADKLMRVEWITEGVWWLFKVGYVKTQHSLRRNEWHSRVGALCVDNKVQLGVQLSVNRVTHASE